MYCRSGNAVGREPVTYSSTAAGEVRPSISISASRRCIRSTSAGSVRPSRYATVTFVRLRRPTCVSYRRSDGVRRWRRSRLVFVRTVSVKASFGPLTVFSTSGADGDRFSPVFVSKAIARSPNSTTVKPLTSFIAASFSSLQGTATAL